MRWRLPLQMKQRPAERHSALPRLGPTKVMENGDLTTLSALPRPRGRKWKAGKTWKGIGRQGEKRKGEETRLELLEAKAIGVVDPGASAASRLPVGESVDDLEGDQAMEDPEQVDLHPRRRQGRLA